MKVVPAVSSVRDSVSLRLRFSDVGEVVLRVELQRLADAVVDHDRVVQAVAEDREQRGQHVQVELEAEEHAHAAVTRRRARARRPRPARSAGEAEGDVR